MHPMLLAALERFSGHEMERLLDLLEVIAVRFQLIYRGRPGRIESLGARTAKEIWNRKITTASEVRIRLNELYVADGEFKELFKKAETDGKKARYLLTVLERQSLQREAKTFPEELIPGEVTLEHIFPKSPRENWKKELDEDPNLAEILNRLGNLCLLPGINRALGNKPWEEKLQVYSRSRLRLTNNIDSVRYPKWGRAAIEKRQGYMAELAEAAWRFQ
jgi:uncharacterized protein DUF1524